MLDLWKRALYDIRSIVVAASERLGKGLTINSGAKGEGSASDAGTLMSTQRLCRRRKLSEDGVTR